MIRQLLVAALVGLALGAPSTKIDGQLRQVLNYRGVANIVVSFEDTAEVHSRIASQRFATRGIKITTMKAQLEELAAKSQASALSILKSRSATFESLWINNRIYVTGANAELVESLASLPEVTEVREEIVVQIEEPIQADNNTILAEWGVEKIEATSAWALPGGNNGAGVVVSTIDTGVRATHQAVRNNFRSQNGWYDPYTRTASPTDNNGHGTHTLSTIAGSNGVGVAPGAQWISCRGCSTSSCTETALSTCGQFITCPTTATGASPNCNLAPNLVSNSWGGGQGSTWYNSIITAWRNAGIIPLFSQGNSGPACGSANSPADNLNVIAVGSTTSADGVSDFSSRGPRIGGGVKPDVSAPGSNIRAAWYTSDTAYNIISGTSMACPHAAGAVALLLSRNPNLTYDQVKNLLQNQADRNLGNAATCGGTPPSAVPNNIYGYGRINARKSLSAAISGY